MMKSVTKSSCAAWALSLCLGLSLAFAGASRAGEPRVLRIPIDEEPDSFNVARVSDYYSAMVASQVIEGLTGIVVKEGREVAVPACAESWETSEDGLTWTFRLREMKWADGEPLRASDFVYGISRVLDPATASPISGKVRFIKNAGDVLLGRKPLSELGLEIGRAHV